VNAGTEAFLIMKDIVFIANDTTITTINYAVTDILDLAVMIA
jgi:hypothetical protein